MYDLIGIVLGVAIVLTTGYLLYLLYRLMVDPVEYP